MCRSLLYALVILAAALSSILSCGDIPVCYADNSTSVNVTLSSSDLEEIAVALNEKADTLEDIGTIFSEIFEFIPYLIELLLLLVFTGFALREKDNVFLYCVSAAMSVLAGIELLDIITLFALIFFPFSGYMLYEAVIHAFFRNKTKVEK